MSSETFGDYIRKAREARDLPLRKVAAHLDIDTSTLSKIERGARPALRCYLLPLTEILQLDLEELQIRFIVEKIKKDFAGLKYLPAGLKAAEKEIQKTDNA